MFTVIFYEKREFGNRYIRRGNWLKILYYIYRTVSEIVIKKSKLDFYVLECRVYKDLR